jgi:hypothetical protein
MIDLLAKGAVRVGDVEAEVHFTPTYFALRKISSVIAGSTAATALLTAALKYRVGLALSDEIFLQTTNPSQSGYIYGWHWVTLTGLPGYIGTAVGFAFSGVFTSTIPGTLTWFYLQGDCIQGICEPHFSVNLGTLGLIVSSGEPVRFHATILTGISGWSVIARSNYTGTIATITPNIDFLRNISAFFLPLPVASLPPASPRGYIGTLVIGPFSTGVSISPSTYQASFYASVYADQYAAVSTISWIGRDTIYITWPSPSTLILYNTLAVHLTTPMHILPGGYNYFTLLITFVG